LSVRIHSPTKDVIGVNIEHFASLRRHPEIELFPDDPPIHDVHLSKEGSNLVISSGDLKAEITENPYSITFKSPDRVLTSAGPKYQAIFDVPSHWTNLSASNSSCLTHDVSSNPRPEPLPTIVRYINSELNISPGELIYGFGEQFGTFVKNGMPTKRGFFSDALVVNFCPPSQASLSKSGIKMEELPVIKHTNVFRSISPTETTVSSSTTLEK